LDITTEQEWEALATLEDEKEKRLPKKWKADDKSLSNFCGTKRIKERVQYNIQTFFVEITTSTKVRRKVWILFLFAYSGKIQTFGFYPTLTTQGNFKAEDIILKRLRMTAVSLNPYCLFIPLVGGSDFLEWKNPQIPETRGNAS